MRSTFEKCLFIVGLIFQNDFIKYKREGDGILIESVSVWSDTRAETLIQHFMSSEEIADTIVGCEKCISNTNDVGFHKFDVGKYPLRLWKIQSGMDQRYNKLNLLEEMTASL